MPTSETPSLLLTDLEPIYREQLSTQEYNPKPKINGLQVIDLRPIVDDGGSFVELVRLDEDGYVQAIPGFKVRQNSFSIVLPNAIKAFHLHFNQDDVWFVPPSDRMLLGLLDCRENSQSVGVSQRIVLGVGRTQLVFIPRGVAHGVTNQASVPGTIFYYVNQQFDINKPDEHRLPYDLLGEEFWKMTPG